MRHGRSPVAEREVEEAVFRSLYKYLVSLYITGNLIAGSYLAGVVVAGSSVAEVGHSYWEEVGHSCWEVVHRSHIEAAAVALPDNRCHTGVEVVVVRRKSCRLVVEKACRTAEEVDIRHIVAAEGEGTLNSLDCCGSSARDKPCSGV